jgi:hypothetical protein
MWKDIEQLVIGSKYLSPARSMSDSPEGKVTFHMS